MAGYVLLAAISVAERVMKKYGDSEFDRRKLIREVNLSTDAYHTLGRRIDDLRDRLSTLERYVSEISTAHQDLRSRIMEIMGHTSASISRIVTWTDNHDTKERRREFIVSLLIFSNFVVLLVFFLWLGIR